MEIPTLSLSHSKLPNFSFPASFHSRASLFAYNYVPNNISNKIILKQLKGFKIRSRQHAKLGVVLASSDAPSPPANVAISDRFLLEPVGDGDSRHLGYKAAMPGAFEIASDEVIVGRLPDKADMVISISTVSGKHARIQKKSGNIEVTDLDSTNGTFIDEKRLTPGVASIAMPGSCISFGDNHLALFRVSKLKTSGEVQSHVEGSSETESDSSTVEGSSETESDTSSDQST